MRNRPRPALRVIGLTLTAWTIGAGLIVTGAGCATSGPHHVYATLASAAAIQDLTAGNSIPAILAPHERASGLAYDFNTDHLFLRIVPTQTVRVVERPSGKILREMPLPAELRTPAPSADLAIRSSDRHLFAVHADGISVVELTLYGKPLRQFPLAGLTAGDSIQGLAYDQIHSRVLALVAGSVRTYDHEGRELARVTLSAALHPTSLGYDSDAALFFVPIDSGSEVGKFSSTGQLLEKIPAPDEQAVSSLDAGRRSLVRVF